VRNYPQSVQLTLFSTVKIVLVNRTKLKASHIALETVHLNPTETEESKASYVV